MIKIRNMGLIEQYESLGQTQVNIDDLHNYLEGTFSWWNGQSYYCTDVITSLRLYFEGTIPKQSPFHLRSNFMTALCFSEQLYKLTFPDFYQQFRDELPSDTIQAFHDGLFYRHDPECVNRTHHFNQLLDSLQPHRGLILNVDVIKA